MALHEHLPTYLSGQWSVTAFKKSLVSILKTDRTCSELNMYFYAVTGSGWDQVREPILRWMQGRKGRRVTLIVGTDHGITDPAAMSRIQDDCVSVRLMREYQGIFHPKVVWLRGAKKHFVWVGSNNLTRDGLSNNVEFAMLVKSSKVPTALSKWTKLVEAGSAPLTRELLDSYESERRKFEARRENAKVTTFTWKQKAEPKKKARKGRTASGELIVEVMPKETGTEGKQLQIPVRAAQGFFGLKPDGKARIIRLKAKGGSEAQDLTMKLYRNRTTRLSIRDLEHRDRPCVIVFRKRRGGSFEYEIVPQSIFPRRYSELLERCAHQTHKRSRRWAIT